MEIQFKTDIRGQTKKGQNITLNVSKGNLKEKFWNYFIRDFNKIPEKHEKY